MRDLNLLRKQDFTTIQHVQSDLWMEAYDCANPQKVMCVSNEREFWEFVFSDNWAEYSSLRLTEGELLTRFTHALHELHIRQSLQTYKMARFDVIDRLAHTALKQTNDMDRSATRPLVWVKQPVKITFTYYAIPPAADCFPSTRSDFSSRWSMDTLPTCTTYTATETSDSDQTTKRQSSSRRGNQLSKSALKKHDHSLSTTHELPLSDSNYAEGVSHESLNIKHCSVLIASQPEGKMDKISVSPKVEALFVLQDQSNACGENGTKALTDVTRSNSMLNKPLYSNCSRVASLFPSNAAQSVLDTVVFYDADDCASSTTTTEALGDGRSSPTLNSNVATEVRRSRPRLTDPTEHVAISDDEDDDEDEHTMRSSFVRKDAISLSHYFETKHKKLKNKTGLLNPLLVGIKELKANPPQELSRLGLKLPWKGCQKPQIKKPPSKPRQSMYFRFGCVQERDMHAEMLVSAHRLSKSKTMEEVHCGVSRSDENGSGPQCSAKAWVPLMRPPNSSQHKANVNSKISGIVHDHDMTELDFVPFNPDRLKNFHTMENLRSWRRFEKYKAEINLTPEQRTQIFTVLDPLVENSMVPKVQPHKIPRKYKLKPQRRKNHNKGLRFSAVKSAEVSEMPSLFRNDTFAEFNSWLERAAKEFIVRMEQVTFADSYKSLTCVTINKRPCCRYAQI